MRYELSIAQAEVRLLRIALQRICDLDQRDVDLAPTIAREALVVDRRDWSVAA